MRPVKPGKSKEERHKAAKSLTQLLSWNLAIAEATALTLFFTLDSSPANPNCFILDQLDILDKTRVDASSGSIGTERYSNTLYWNNLIFFFCCLFLNIFMNIIVPSCPAFCWNVTWQSCKVKKMFVWQSRLSQLIGWRNIVIWSCTGAGGLYLALEYVCQLSTYAVRLMK